MHSYITTAERKWIVCIRIFAVASTEQFGGAKQVYTELLCQFSRREGLNV